MYVIAAKPSEMKGSPKPVVLALHPATRNERVIWLIAPMLAAN